MPDDTDAAIGQLSSALRLNTQELDLLHRFPADQIRILAGAVQQALTTQRHEIDEALENVLKFIPRPLRGRGRKLLFPGGGHG